MNSYYDITNPDISFDWLHEVLHMKQGGLIDEYCLECHNDFDRFYEKFLPEINEIDIESLEIAAFQVTSNDNGCADIKKHGLRNLCKCQHQNAFLFRHENVVFHRPAFCSSPSSSS